MADPVRTNTPRQNERQSEAAAPTPPAKRPQLWEDRLSGLSFQAIGRREEEELLYLMGARGFVVDVYSAR